MQTLALGADPLSLIPTQERLMRLAGDQRTEYASARPYPHVVLDDFLDAAVAEAIHQQFPAPDALDWERFHNARERKLASAHEGSMPPLIRSVLYAMNSASFLQFLETLTGIANLIGDPLFAGGGMHQIVPGGKLGIHVDFNRHPVYRLDRRLNLLLYLNQDWRDEYGGHFELWDRTGTSCVKRVLPIFNRCVVFSTTETSYHGHPHPLSCPAGWVRKSLALYYYSNGRPESEIASRHGTVFVGADAESTLTRIGRGVRTAVRELLPPIVTRLVRRGRHRS
jgi:Rps23 Pro-64 3,4-dihydroxylase Tpa1-like proline 4-hydroxylase